MDMRQGVEVVVVLLIQKFYQIFGQKSRNTIGRFNRNMKIYLVENYCLVYEPSIYTLDRQLNRTKSQLTQVIPF